MKFTIRDLLLLTVIVALAAGWWVDRTSLEDDLRIARELIDVRTQQIDDSIYKIFDKHIKEELPKSPYPICLSKQAFVGAILAAILFGMFASWVVTSRLALMPNSSAPDPNPPKP